MARLTDDTQMALFTTEGLIRASVRSRDKGICDHAPVLWFAYQRWLYTQGETAKRPREGLVPTVGRWLAGR